MLMSGVAVGLLEPHCIYYLRRPPGTPRNSQLAALNREPFLASPTAPVLRENHERSAFVSFHARLHQSMFCSTHPERGMFLRNFSPLGAELTVPIPRTVDQCVDPSQASPETMRLLEEALKMPKKPEWPDLGH